MTWCERYPAQKLVAYDPRWADRFEALTRRLRAHLGAGWEFEHVGSTSVPGLCAKPVIDIAAAMPPGASAASFGEAFTVADWSEPVALGDHLASFLLDGTVRTAILHLFTHEAWPAAHLRLFADWLRHHDVDRDAYASLKSDLVGSDVWGSAYTEAKRASS